MNDRIRFRRPVAVLVTVAAMSLAVTCPVAAQQGEPPSAIVSGEPTAVSRLEPATLVVNNRTIVTFHAELLGFLPTGRVRAAERRIEDLLATADGRELAVQEAPGGFLLTLGGRGLFMITPADVDELGGERLEDVARAAAASLDLALRERLEARDAKRMTRAVGAAVGSTALFLVAILLLRRVYRWLRERLKDLAEAWAGRASVWGLTVVGPDEIIAMLRRLVLLGTGVLALVAAYGWLVFVLELFPYTRPWGEELGSFLLGTVKLVLATTVGWVPGLAVVAVIFVVIRFITRLVTVFFQAVEQGKADLPEAVVETAQPTRRIVVALLWVFGVVMAYPYLPGSRSEAFKGISVFIGLMISLGASGVVGQFLSGLVTMYSRALRPGDYVRIGDDEGVVLSLGMLSTKIRTNKREEINIPNSVLVNSATKNYTRQAGEHGVILYTSVTIGYDTPWRQVHAMLVEAARRTEGLRPAPPPFVNQTALSDFYVEYQLNAHLERPERRPRTLAALHANIQDVFNEHGVQILSPHYEADPPAKVWVPKERWYAPPATPPEEG